MLGGADNSNGELPSYIIGANTRRMSALIFGNPSDGKSLTAERVGQQPLQGFNPAVPAFPRCLYDTRLQPSRFPVALGPVNAVPCFRFV